MSRMVELFKKAGMIPTTEAPFDLPTLSDDQLKKEWESLRGIDGREERRDAIYEELYNRDLI